jgi:probable rRNA maturation factor
LANRQRLSAIDTRSLRAAIRLALGAEGVRQAHVELALVDDQTIRQAHHRFLKLNTPTDVLTFPLHDLGEPLAGVIVVSVETARRVAPQHGNTTDQEVQLYAIHGVLHLCGYDDRTRRDARRMRRRQDVLISQIKKEKATNQKRRPKRFPRDHRNRPCGPRRPPKPRRAPLVIL